MQIHLDDELNSLCESMQPIVNRLEQGDPKQECWLDTGMNNISLRSTKEYRHLGYIHVSKVPEGYWISFTFPSDRGYRPGAYVQFTTNDIAVVDQAVRAGLFPPTTKDPHAWEFIAETEEYWLRTASCTAFGLLPENDAIEKAKHIIIATLKSCRGTDVPACIPATIESLEQNSADQILAMTTEVTDTWAKQVSCQDNTKSCQVCRELIRPVRLLARNVITVLELIAAWFTAIWINRSCLSHISLTQEQLTKLSLDIVGNPFRDAANVRQTSQLP